MFNNLASPLIELVDILLIEVLWLADSTISRLHVATKGLICACILSGLILTLFDQFEFFWSSIHALVTAVIETKIFPTSRNIFLTFHRNPCFQNTPKIIPLKHICVYNKRLTWWIHFASKTLEILQDLAQMWSYKCCFPNNNISGKIITLSDNFLQNELTNFYMS